MAHFKLFEDKLLGEGAFGRVYKCLWHGSPAAAKQLNVVKGDETAEITKEIEMIEKLHNDYIIQFFGTGHYNGKLCLITSHAENGSLRRALNHTIISNELKPSIITGLIRGMHYLKSNKVVHRDFKSPNVLLGPNFVPKICDFGLAVLKLNSATVTMTSTPKGTVRWMAPELFELKPRYSFASDVYALGVVIWEILTGQVPYAQNDSDSVRFFIISGQRENIPDSIPEHYKSIIENCWRLDPKDRNSIEEISKVNEEVVSRISNARDDDTSAIDIGNSIQHVHSDSGGTSLSLKSDILSQLPGHDIPRDPETIDYEKILDEYLLRTSANLDTSVHLVSALNKHGDNFAQWIKAAANQGNKAAVTVLGEMYYHGCKVPQDYEAAFKQFSTAAKNERLFFIFTKQGIACAQNNLGRMYEGGRGVPLNYHKAVEWYTKAAEQGDADAQVNLGGMYRNGRGVPQSDDRAVEWYTKAAEQGYENAQFNLGVMYENGRGALQSDDKAAEWYMKAAEQGHAAAQCSLALMYQNGHGVPQSDDKAVEWYTKAAEQGHADAQCNLGGMYYHGRGVPQSNEKAVKWYTKAAEQDHARAQFQLGWMYKVGFAVPQSDDKAVEWYTKAAEQGHARAQNNLGWMYTLGRGVPRNDDKAMDWFTKSFRTTQYFKLRTIQY